MTPQTGWQPIETCPKPPDGDFKQWLMVNDSHGYAICCWSYVDDSDSGEMGWMECATDQPFDPTHYMSLPSAPEPSR